MPSARAFCLNEPSDLFINFKSLATGVRALEWAFEQLHIVLRILFAFARRLLGHFMFSRMVVRSRSSTPNSLVKRTDVNKVFDHCTW
jgi:hypothetical protein